MYLEIKFWYRKVIIWRYGILYKKKLFQDWLNEFNIAQEDLDTSSVNVNSNEVRLEDFFRNKNFIPFHYQNDGYEAMDEASEDDFVQIDVEVTVLCL